MPGWVTNLEHGLGSSADTKPPAPGREAQEDRPKGKGKRGGGRNDKRSDYGQRRDDRNQRGRGKAGSRDDRHQRGRQGDRRRGRHDDRDSRPRELPLPQNVSVGLEPSPLAIAALTKHIRSTGRAYALADLAKMVLGSRERYQLRFRRDPSEKDSASLFFAPTDQSLWLTREEAIAHLLHSKLLNRFYEIEEVSVEPPKGNFSVVAVCGFTGHILGPPNHHEYSRNVARIHRERFSDMPLDRYKSRIEMSREEEVIEKWKADVSTRRQFRPRPEPLTEDPDATPPSDSAEPAEEPDAREPAPENSTETPPPADPPVEETSEGPTNEPKEEPKAESDPVEESDAASEEAHSEEQQETPTEADLDSTASAEEIDADAESADEVSEAPPEEAESTSPAEEVEALTSEEALGRHFRQHFADTAIEPVTEAVLPGNVPGRCLSRPLLNLLKAESEKSRRGFPLPMIQHLCRAFEKEGLKFFKRGKKALHVSVARPRPIRDESAFTDRVREIVQFVREHPKARAVDLLDALVADYRKPVEGESFEDHHLTQDEHEVLADLRWLTMEGYVIEFPNTELILGKMDPSRPPSGKKSAPSPSKKPGEKPAVETPAPEASDDASSEPEEAPAAEAPTSSPSSPPEINPSEEAEETEEALPSAPESPQNEDKEEEEKEEEKKQPDTAEEKASGTPPEPETPSA